MAMATAQTTAVGVFQTRDQVEKAVDALRRNGFRNDQIGVVAKNTEGKTVVTKDGSDTKAEEGLAAGAAAGVGVGSLVGLGVLSGVIPVIGPAILAGTLGTIVSNAVAGAAVAGLTGALVGYGIPEDDAKHYESEIAAGRYVVTVQANGRFDDACRVLGDCGATCRSASASR